MTKNDVKKFKRLIVATTTQKIFHKNFIYPKCKTREGKPVDYKYFNMQLNGHTTMLKEVEDIIQKYIADVNK